MLLHLSSPYNRTLLTPPQIGFIFALPALYTIDTWGRRTLLLSTFPFMILSLLGAALSFLIPSTSNFYIPSITLFLTLFVIAYTLGEGPVAFVYSSEVFPLSHREIGMSWAVATNNFWAAALGLTFPAMLQDLGATGSFVTYAGLCALAGIWIFAFVPETKMRSLEELDRVFGISTRVHAKYQVVEVLPWWVRRYVFRSGEVEGPELYGFEEQKE